MGISLTGKASKKDFDYFIEQLNAKLIQWKTNQLSFVGQVTLAKSVLEAIHIYPMMTSIIHKRCIDEIHRIQRRFIQGDTERKRRYHVVGWDTISRPLKNEGLGLRRLKQMNESCILKIGRNLKVNSKELCCEVLRGKYKCNTTADVIEAKMTHSHLWKYIAKMWHILQECSRWNIGNGRNIDLCKDAWIVEVLRLVDCNIQIPEKMVNAKVWEIVNNEGVYLEFW